MLYWYKSTNTDAAHTAGGEAHESRDSETSHTSDAVERMLSGVCLYETNDKSDAVERTDAQAATALQLAVAFHPSVSLSASLSVSLSLCLSLCLSVSSSENIHR